MNHVEKSKKKKSNQIWTSTVNWWITVSEFVCFLCSSY